MRLIANNQTSGITGTSIIGRACLSGRPGRFRTVGQKASSIGRGHCPQPVEELPSGGRRCAGSVCGDVWSGNVLAATHTDVSVTEIIHQDDEDVGRGFVGSKRNVVRKRQRKCGVPSGRAVHILNSRRDQATGSDLVKIAVSSRRSTFVVLDTVGKAGNLVGGFPGKHFDMKRSFGDKLYQQHAVEPLIGAGERFAGTAVDRG